MKKNYFNSTTCGLRNCANLNCRLYILLAIFVLGVQYSFGCTTVPSYIGTDINGTYFEAPLTAPSGTFGQYFIQATTGYPSGSRQLNFNCGNNDYSVSWRAYSCCLTISGLNTVIAAGTNPGASYNTSGGGGGSQMYLPLITANRYYTFNVATTGSDVNEYMDVLETTYNPVTISSVSQLPASNVSSGAAVTVTANLSGTPNAGQYFYIRYTTNAWTSSNVVLMTANGTAPYGSIPAQINGVTVSYYVFSSNTNALSTSGQVGQYYDVQSLNLNNNSNNNWSYTTTYNPSYFVSGNFSYAGNGWNQSNATAMTLMNTTTPTWTFTTSTTNLPNSYFTFWSNNSGTAIDYGVNGGSDLQETKAVSWAPAIESGGKSFYMVVGTSGDYFVFKTSGFSTSTGSVGTAQAVVFELGSSNTQPTIGAPSASNTYPGLSNTVTVSLATGSLLSGESLYLRYAPNSWTGTSVITPTSGSGTGPYTFTIPASADIPSATMLYDIIISANGATLTDANADLYSIVLNNNGGNHFSYTVASGWATVASPTVWSAASSWQTNGGLNNVVPPLTSAASMGTVTINGSITEDQNASASSLVFSGNYNITINGTSTLTTTGAISIPSGSQVIFNSGANWAAGAFTLTNGGTIDMTSGGTLTMASGATLANGSATFKGGTGTVAFAGGGTISGTIVFSTVTLAGAVNFGSASSINRVLQILAGGSVLTNAPTYNPSSILQYYSGGVGGGTYGRATEFSTTSGAGYPYNVQVSNNTTLDLGANSGTTTAWQIADSLIIDAGSTFTMNGVANGGTNVVIKPLTVKGGVINAGILDLGGTSGTSGDINVGGNWTFIAGGSFNDNGRAVFLNGGAQQIIARSASGTLNFGCLISTNSSGGVQLSSATNVSINNANCGLQLLGTGTGKVFDLNGNTLTLGTNVSLEVAGAQAINSSSGTGTVVINSGGTSSVYVSGSGTLTTSAAVTVDLNAAFNFGASLTTINGILVMNNSSASVNTNPPTYGTTSPGSTLIYNTGTNKSVGAEWTAGTATTGAGIPDHVQIGMSGGNTSSALNLGSGTYTMNGNLTYYNITGAALTTSGTLYVGGNWVNNTANPANFNAGTPAGTVVFFNGGAGAQTIGGNNTSANGYDFYNLTINNSSGVSLANSAPVSASHVLSINSGIFTTTSGTLSVTATAGGAITTTGSFSNTLFINGPVTWSLTTGTTYLFPVGASNTYLPFGLTGVTGSSPTVTVQVVNSAASGSPTYDATLVGISPNEYWKTSGTGFSTASTVSLTSAASVSGGYNTVGQSTTAQSGSYTSLGGAIAGNTITSTSGITSLGYFVMAQAPLPTVTGITYNSPTVTGQPANSLYYGQNITISGNYFTGVSSVYFGTTQVTSFTTGSGSVTLNVPVAPSGSNQITVVGTYGTGPAYAVSYLGYITDAHSSNDYNSSGAWAGLTGIQVPPASSLTTVNNSGITISGASNSPTTLTITSAGTLNINNTAGAITATTLINNGTLTISAAAASAVTATTLTNGGNITFTAGGTLSVASSGSASNSGTITTTSGATLSIGTSSTLTNGGSIVMTNGGTLTFVSANTFTNNSTFTAGTGTVLFTGNSSTINGSSAITFNNLTYNLNAAQALTIPTSGTIPTVNGTLLVEGGHLASAPNYGNNSILAYNAASYTVSNEWTPGATSGTGVPQDVLVGAGTNTALTFSNPTTGDAYYQLNDSLTIANGSSMTLTGDANSPGLRFKGSITNNGTYNDNGRGTIFIGTTTQGIASSAALSLNYLILNGTGNLQIGSGNITLAGHNDALQFLNTGKLDLNGNTLTFNGGAGIELNSGASNVINSTGTGTLSLSGVLNIPTTGSGTLTTASSVTIIANGNLNIENVSALTIAGTLQMNGGGYAGTNAPVYSGSTSTLVYNSVGNPYGNNNEWTGGGSLTVAVGTGIPGNVILQGSGTNQVNLAGARGVPGAITTNSTTNTLNLSGDLYLGGNLTVNGPLITNSKAVWFTEGSAQSINSTSYPNVTFDYLLINKTSNSVTLNIPIKVNQILTLSGGNINSTTTNIITIINTGTGGIASGSTLSYINGPVNWTLPSNPAGPYIFPVGDAVNNGGAYLPLSLANITSASGTIVQVQATNTTSGGSYNGAALEAISASEYWQVSQVSGTYASASVSLTRQTSLSTSTPPVNAIGWNNTGAGGQYAYEAGTVSGTSINNSNVVGAGYLVMAEELPAPVISTVTVGTALNGQGANTGYIGQTVTISGSNFSSNDNVTFNGTAPINVIITPPSTITAIVNIGTSITTGTVVVTDPATTLQGSAAFTNLGYISANSTDWNTNNTWLNGGSGATNFTGTSAIPVANTTVTIVNTVGVSAAVTNAPNTVTVTSAGDLSFSGGSLTVNTTLTNAGTVDMTSGGTLTMGSGSTLANNGAFTGGTGTVSFSAAGTISGSTAANLTNLTINAGSVALTTPPNVSGTLLMNNTSAAVTGNPVYGASSTLTYNANLTKGPEWSSVAATHPGYVIVQNNSLLHTGAPSAALNIGHDLTLGNGTGSGSLNMDNDVNALIVGGNINIGGSSGTSTLTLSSVAGGDIKLSGNWSLNANGSFAPATRSVFFTGGNAQTITGVTAFDYINMDKTGNTNVTLNNNISVNHTIFLSDAGTGGDIVTGSNTVQMASTAATTNASDASHIVGNESYNFTSGNLSFTFDIGDATYVSGVNVTYSSISTGGTLTAFETDGNHPQIATSGIYAPHSVLIYHTLANSGIVGGNYTATFYFNNPNELGSGSVTGNFAVMEYASSAWNATTTGTQATNSTQATGLSTYGAFQVGDMEPQGSLTSAGSICAGATGQLIFTSTAGTGPFSVTYSDGSNHVASGVVSGTPFNIYSGPASTTNYTLVSVTDNIGDVRSSGFTGGSATQTVIPTTPSSVSIIASPSIPICQGQSVSFIASPTYGGSSPTYNFEVNNVSVQSGSSTVLTSNTINNNDVIKCLMTSNAVCPSPTTSTSNSITETVNALPSVYNVTGGGNFCPGGSAAVGLSNSQTGVNYELKNGASDVAGPVAGNTGNSITFGNQSTAATYTVVATNGTTGCVNNMSGSAVVIVNPQAATPGISTPSTTVCSGQPVTFTASGGTQYGFNVNGAPVGSISTTNTYTTSSLNNGDQVSATSYTPFTFDGNITESAWGTPIQTSTGGPYDNGGTFFGGGPSFGAGHEINALYAQSDANNINFAIAGNVQNGNRILLFIQSKSSGGYNTGNFGRLGASSIGGIYNFPSNTTFDFNPDYILAIGANSGQTDYFFDLYTLSGTASSGGGPDTYLGDIAVGANAGAVLGANPANGTQTRGFEVAIPKTLLNYTSGTVTVFAMYISDGGFMSNQFLTHAGAGAGSYGNTGPFTFNGNPGSFAIPALNLADNCSATSTPITMSIGSNLTPTIGINASATTICTGTTVNFTSNITNGGSSPSYQWYKNTNPVGTNSTYSDNGLNNGDQIQCVLTSNASCVSTPTASSNTITMTVNSSITPSVTIAASPSGAVCAGTNVTFTPTPTFGGTSPTYQWYDGVTLVGSSASFSSTSLANGDVITCSMTSNAGCASPATVTSTNSITMSVNPLPTVYAMTGGGSYCSGTSGVVIGLANSQTNVNYQLYSGVSTVGGTVPGNTGSAITFGPQTTNGTNYNVIATTSLGCSAPMSGTETVYTNIAPATPSIFASENPICTGTSVSISAINGSLFQFFVNGNSQGAESTTNNFSSSAFANGDQVTVTSYSSIVYDGNISEAIWGSPLATSTGGPSPGFGTGDELNAVYANGDGSRVNFAIAGDVSSGNRILLFIDSKSGGYNTANFDETNAPPGLAKFNQGTTFDAGFNPDYCLVIGVNGSNDNYFDLFTLGANSGSGTNAYLGGRTIHNFGVQAGGNPSAGSQTQGFEISLPNSLLGYTAGSNIQVMGMIISESTGTLSNQFLTRANVSENNYGSGAVTFGSAAPNPVTVSQYALNNTCTATSTPITMSVSPVLGSGTLGSITPTAGTYCAGTLLSATATAGSGGPSGTVTDVLQYSTNGGSSWTPYSSGNTINSSGLSTVEIETYRTSTVAGCTSSTPNTVNWTLNPTPTLFNVTGGACAPASIGLSGSQSGSNYVYQLYVTYNSVTTPLTSLTGTGSALAYGDQVDPGTYTVVATNTATGCVANMNAAATVDLCTDTWLGTYSTLWSDYQNWSLSAVPNNCYVSVIINAGTTFAPTISGGDIYVKDMSIASGVTLTLAGNNLNVCGNWTGGSGTNAAVIGSGTVFMNSPTVAQAISGNTQFNILQINNSAGVTANRSAIVAISTGLQLAKGTFDVSIATLHLLSTASNNNSYVDDFSFGGNPGVLSGAITADRYVPVKGSNQHYISSPVATPAFSQFNATGPDGAYIIPTTYCDEQASSYTSPYGTMFQYNDGHQASGACMLGNWQIRSSGSTVNGQGYSTYLPGNTTLSLTSTANTGNMNVSTFNSAYPAVPTLQQSADGGNGAIESGWALVGNPYPSALDLTVDRTTYGYDNQVQVWKTSGPFAGTWQATTITGEAGTVVIPPFQAFMVHVSTVKARGNYTYPFFQSERTRTTNIPFYRSQNQNTLQLALDYNGIQDITTVSFNPSATNSFDAQFDANKQDGSAGNPTLYTFFAGATTWYSINTVSSLTQTAAIPMGLRPNNTGTMTITPQGIESFDPTTYIYLEDKQTGIWTNLRNGSYTFTTTPTDNQQRFVLHFTPPAIVLTQDASCDAPGMINIQQPGTANWNYTVTDVNNVTVASGMLNAGAPVTVSVNSGVYTLTLTDNSGYTVVKNVEIGGVQPVSSAFTASATTVQVQQNITFNGAADNASVYDWDFGDGAAANGAQSSHSYQSEGIYSAKLTVTGTSGCISTTSQTITVTSRSVTGITNIAENKLNIWSYDNTVFVDFSNVDNVNAEVQLYNVLGQMLSDERFGKSTLYSKELTNMEAAYIIVKVTNDDQVTTKKVFIANVNK